MTEKKIDQTDLSKALSALQDLAKGHGSKGTATTKVETMAGESGSTQIFHTASNSDPGGWAGSSWRGEGWEDSINANGTDLDSVKKLGKSIASGIMTKLSKGQELTARELGFVSKGGLNFLKDGKDEDKADKAFPPKKEDDVEKAHADAAEDKEQIKDMVKPGAIKKSDVSKSFTDHAAEHEVLSKGFEVSEFLAGFAQVMHKSLTSMEARITDRVLTAVARSAEETGSVQKSMAEAVAALGEVLAAQAQRIDQVETGPARAAKSATMAKSGGYRDSAAEGGEDMNKSQITEKLVELVQKGQATAQDVLKFDATGEITPELRRKVASR